MNNLMDSSNDPEIICVFCGLGFISVENVELHIHENHQSTNLDQIENRKTSNVDDYGDHTQIDDSYFVSNETKTTNLIVLQKDFKLDNQSQLSSEIIRPKLLNKVCSQPNRKANRLINLTQKESDYSKETGFYLENNNVNDNRASAMLNISETIANLVDDKVDKVMKRSLRCQSCDKQFTLSNNLSRHRRLYCSSLKENLGQINYCQNGAIEPNKVPSSSNVKCIMINKSGDISKQSCEDDSFIIKKENVRTKISRPLQRHKCPKCLKRFIFKIAQMIHIRNHEINNNRKWNCEKCGFRYSNKQVLLRHYQRHCSEVYSSKQFSESNKDTNICHFCDMVFIDPIYLEMHQIKVCRTKLFSTKTNQSSTNNCKSNSPYSGIRDNILSNTYENSKAYINSGLPMSKQTCSKSCSTNQSIFENESSPRSPENQLNGSVRGSIISNNGNQKFHWHNCNGETQHKSFQCEVCKKSFSSRSSLSNHIKSHYSSRGQPFTCRDCNRRFVNLLSLQDHRREMCSQKTNESEQKAIYNLSNFNGVSQVPIWPNIVNLNSGNQPVTCLHCNGVFYDRLELEEHALSKHSNEQGNILCLLCDRSFTTNMALRVHLTKSHGFANGGCPGVSQNLPPMPKLETNYHIGSDFPLKKRRKEKRFYDLDKEYICDNCHRNFSTGQALGNHKRACLNIPNELISVESKPPSQNSKSNSRLHSIESLIFDNTNIRSSFTNDKNVFLAFN